MRTKKAPPPVGEGLGRGLRKTAQWQISALAGPVFTPPSAFFSCYRPRPQGNVPLFLMSAVTSLNQREVLRVVGIAVDQGIQRAHHQ